MAGQVKPDISDKWASAGATTDPGSAKLQLGWIAEIPPHQWQNFWQLRTDEFLTHVNEEGIPVWDSTTDYPDKGWAKGSDGEVYVSNTTPNINNDPTTDPEWDLLSSLLTVPDATTSVKGKARLATNAEVQAGSLSDVIVTPSGLASLTATTTRAGLIEQATQTETNNGTAGNLAVTAATLNGRTSSTSQAGLIEIATTSEAQTGTDDTRALTPKKLQDVSATETRAGVAEIATTSETTTGTDDVKIVTPLKLEGKLSSRGVTAWVTFEEVGGTVAVHDSFGIDSVVRTATGRYTVNITSGVMANDDYSVVGSAEVSSSTRGVYVSMPNGGTRTTSALQIQTQNSGDTFQDSDHVSLIFFGGQ